MAAPGDISTVAGNTKAVGDGGSAVGAWLSYPEGTAVDGSGNVYITDTGHDRIRKVDASGTITTVAGNGSSGFSGDGGPATSARVNVPGDIALDGVGNLYIADVLNHRVRKVDSSGTITTVAGNGSSGFSGDGGPATSARLSYPYGVVPDNAGNLYIADYFNNRVRKVDTSGTITTVAGGGSGGLGDGGPATSATLAYPVAAAVDGSGNLYIADNGNLRVRKVDTAGTITTVAGGGSVGLGDGGPATSAIVWPQGITLDGSGNLYIADSDGDRVRKVDTSGTITTVAGNGLEGFSGDGGPATSAQFALPLDVAVDGSGNLYIADAENDRVRKVTTSGTITTMAGGGVADGGPATSARLSYPKNVTTDAAGNLYIADTFDHRVRKVDTAGVIMTVAGNGLEGFSGDGGVATGARLALPSGLAFDGSGNLYIADRGNDRVRKVDTAGVITTVAGGGAPVVPRADEGGPATAAGLDGPMGVAVDGSGNLYIADTFNHRVRKVNILGLIVTVAGGAPPETLLNDGDGLPATAAELSHPRDVAVDSSGNLYIADALNHRVRKVGLTGTISTVAGNGLEGFSGDGGAASSAQLDEPSGVAVDVLGNVYIADRYNNRVRKVSPPGTITTAAGVGGAGYFGDGGPATSAVLRNPTGVSVDGSGNIYIADTHNHVVRKVQA